MPASQSSDLVPESKVEPAADIAVAPTGPDPSITAHDAMVAGVLTLAILAVIYTFYVGRDIVLPVVMAAVLNLLLQPVMRVLNVNFRLPMPIAALAVIITVFTIIVALAYAVSSASSGWIDHAPESLAILKQKLAFLSEPLSYVQKMLHSVENIGAPTTGTETAKPATEGNTLPAIILFGTASTIMQFLTTMLVLYFMLATGDRLLRGVIEVLPRFRDKRRAVEISSEIQLGISGYLLTITVMNAAVGFVTACAMWACGLAQPVLWGAVAFLLNFVPIIGPIVGIGVFFVAGLVALPWPFPALAPVLAYGLIHLVEGEVVTPLLVARRFELNPVLIILSLLFWHAIWGVPGALLAVPLLAIFKIFADRIEPLKSVAHLIGS